MTTPQDLLDEKKGRVFRILPSATLAEAARELVEHGISSLVVAEDGHILGLFTKNDLTRCCAECPGSLEETRVSEYMKTNVFTTTPDADLEELIRTMVREDFHHVPVSADGKAVGMITYGDILASEHVRLLHEEEDLLNYIQGVY